MASSSKPNRTDTQLRDDIDAGPADTGHGRAQRFSDSIEEVGLSDLAAKARRRFPKQPEQPDLLPDLSEFDLEAAKTTLVEKYSGDPPRSRRTMLDQSDKLLDQFSGKPELLFWNALSISYLRRRTKHTGKARGLFFKIWDEQGSWLAERLPARWLVSSLQTFADHGRTAAEKQCGTAGFMYGNMIKIYETEIRSCYIRADAPERYSAGAVKGLHGFQPGDDILLNINRFVLGAAVNAGPSAEALVRLLALVRNGDTIFSRTDEMIRSKGEGFWAFAEPTPSGKQSR